jgi:uncharacterized membrane protein
MKRLLMMVCTLLLAGRCLAQYTFISADFPGAAVTRFVGLNDHLDIVGNYVMPGQFRHAMKFSHGEFTPLDPTGVLGTHASSATQINNRGDVTGWYADTAGRHGFLLRDGVLTTIDYPGGNFSQVNGITDNGVVIGHFQDGNGIFHGYILKDGMFTQLDVPGAVDTLPFYMNARGDIVGEWDPDPALIGHGFLLPKNGPSITIDAPGAPENSTLAIGINDHGEILGVFQEVSGSFRGFVVPAGDLAPENFIFFDTPGSSGFPETINNAGVFIGFFTDSAGTHGFIATPARGQKG